MRQHQVALAFEDGVTRFISCTEDQTVADASYRARINIPLDCRDGACGTCKAFCESGEFDGGTYIDDALSPDEAKQGYALPCSMKPRSDLVLQIASTSEVAKTQAATYVGHLTELNRLSPTTMALHPRDPEPRRAGFPSGAIRQHRGPGHRREPVLLIQQCAGRESPDLPGEADAGWGDVDVSHGARPGRRRVDLHRSERQLLPARDRASGTAARRRYRTGARSCPSCARCGPGPAGPCTSSTASSTDQDLVELDTLERLAKRWKV